jgi:hypothetical protein
MTIFDWLNRFEFLRGETAVIIVLFAALIVVIVPDGRLALLALAGHYFAAALLFVDVLDLRLALVKLLTGWTVCLMLFVTGWQVNWHRPPADLTPEELAHWQPPPSIRVGRWRLPRLVLPVILAALTLVVVWLLAQRPAFYLPAVPETLAYLNLAIMALIALGLLRMALTDQPLLAGMGALLFLTGFELFYSLLDQTIATLALLAVVNLAVALAVGYLAQAQRAALNCEV